MTSAGAKVEQTNHSGRLDNQQLLTKKVCCKNVASADSAASASKLYDIRLHRKENPKFNPKKEL